jgi:uncharacterized membrane protein
MRLWATLRDWWGVLVVGALAVLAWPDMRQWGIWTWIGFALAVVFTLVVFAAFFHSGTISQAEDRRKWEREQALERARECARRMVEMGICDEEEAA